MHRAYFLALATLTLVLLTSAADALIISYNVTEHAAVETRLGNLTADILRALRLTNGPALSFVLLQCTSKLVVLGAELVVFDDIDREETQFLRCAVAVSRPEDSRVAIPNQITVQVAVLDVNDVPPRWEAGELVALEFLENEPVRSSRSLPLALDTDATAVKLTYNKTRTTLANGSRLAHDPFQFAVTSNALLVSLNSRLDYESHNDYRFYIVASDGRHNATLEVAVRVRDVNEAGPHFPNSTYVFTLAEDFSAYSWFAQVAAHDPDGTDREDGLSYSIVPASQLFEIDNAGNLKLLRELDYEQARLHTFTVLAKDHGQLSASASVTVTVTDVNDVTPRLIGVCSKTGVCTSVDVLENEPAGITDFKVHVSDDDSGRFGEVHCALSSDSDSDKFSLMQDVSSNKVYSLSTRVSFDRERSARYVVTIVCEDDGAADKKSAELRLLVNILDRNDCSPRLASVQAQPGSNSLAGVRDGVPFLEVPENAYVEGVIATFKAEDCDETGGPNSRVTYRLLDETAMSINGAGRVERSFKLQADGTLLLARSLDREATSEYQLRVLLTDEGVPPLNASGLVRVRVLDVIDSAPHFSNRSYRFSVTENAPVGHLLAPLNVTDHDDETLSSLSFQIVDWPPQPQANHTCAAKQRFIIDTLGALRTLSLIDREECPEYVFQLVVSDSAGLRDTANVVVSVEDQNEHPPWFLFPNANNNTVRVRNYRENSPIAHISARDADDNAHCDLSFSVKSVLIGRPDLFLLDELRGDVRLRRRPVHTDVGQHRLMIEVSDCQPNRNNVTQSLTVVIDREAVEPSADDDLTTAYYEGAHRSNQSGASSYSQDNFVLMVCLISVFACMIVLALVALIVLCKRFSVPQTGGAKTRRRSASSRKRQGQRTLRTNDPNNNEQSSKMMLATPASSMRKSTSFSRSAKGEDADNEKNVVMCQACDAQDMHEAQLLQVAAQSGDVLSPCAYRTDNDNSVSEISEELAFDRDRNLQHDRCTLVHCTIAGQSEPGSTRNELNSPSFSSMQTRTAPSTDSMKKRQLVQTIPRRPLVNAAMCNCAECLANAEAYCRVPITMTDLWMSPTQGLNTSVLGPLTPKQVLDAEMMSFVPRSYKQQVRSLPRVVKTALASNDASAAELHSQSQARSSSVTEQPQTRLKSFAKPLDNASYV